MTTRNEGAIAAPQFAGPLWMLRVLLRAAEQMRSTWPHRPFLTFPYYGDNHDNHFRAALTWAADELAPRLVVSDERSGEFICRSMPGRPFDIDPDVFGDGGIAFDQLEQVQR